MAEYGIDSQSFIYTGDCSMITEPNLAFTEGMDNPRVKFISRMPVTFSVVNILIGEAVAKKDWTGIGKAF